MRAEDFFSIVSHANFHPPAHSFPSHTTATNTRLTHVSRKTRKANLIMLWGITRAARVQSLPCTVTVIGRKEKRLSLPLRHHASPAPLRSHGCECLWRRWDSNSKQQRSLQTFLWPRYVFLDSGLEPSNSDRDDKKRKIISLPVSFCTCYCTYRERWSTIESKNAIVKRAKSWIQHYSTLTTGFNMNHIQPPLGKPVVTDMTVVYEITFFFFF